MSVGMDEVGYGRLCLLMLHTCPLRLRCVIDNSYCRGVPDFETLLNNNLHQLFHLRYKNCCCGNTSNNTHISKSQWDLLYSKISTRNPHGRRGECPCQYTAKNGVTSDVLDITFCCLFLTNFCFGVSLTDVDTIRQIRNGVIHAITASIDVQSFNDKWKKVEQALLSLSRTVSLTYESETQTILDELKNRVIDPRELESLVTIMKDHRDYDNLKQVHWYKVLTIVVSVLNRQFSYPCSKRSIRIIHTPNLEVKLIRSDRFGITAGLTVSFEKCEVGMTLWWNGNCIWRHFVGRLGCPPPP